MQSSSLCEPEVDSDILDHRHEPFEAEKPTLRALAANLHDRIMVLLAKKSEVALLQRVQQQTRASLDIAVEALSRYSLNELCMSYNGGKDCLVLLVIYLAALHVHYHKRDFDSEHANSASNSSTMTSRKLGQSFPETIKSVYIRPAYPFPQVDSFVRSSALEYNLDLKTSPGPMKAAFTNYLQDHPEVKAIFVGTRRTDPHGGALTHFDPTDRGWPSFMRIHPVIDWHYQDIWTFIRHLRVPYCSLYDRGYTSLGGTTDTHPNPKLEITGLGPSGEITSEKRFKPAYELQEDDEERLGRE